MLLIAVWSNDTQRLQSLFDENQVYCNICDILIELKWKLESYKGY
jgi:hypothetical protein